VIDGAAPSGFFNGADLVPGEPAWFCRFCRTYFPSRRAVKPDPRECPTENCTNPNGFGRFADVPRPRGWERGRR
jgi:hypothetical protein